MTKSTITREKQRQILIDTAKHIISRERTSPYSENLRELARIALAAMDSEPVAEVLSNRPGNDTSTIDRALPVGTQLYRHAQPASVVPDCYVMVPMEPTDEMIAAAMNCEDVLFNSDDSFCVQFGNIYEAMIAAAPQEVQGE